MLKAPSIFSGRRAGTQAFERVCRRGNGRLPNAAVTGGTFPAPYSMPRASGIT